LDAGESMLLGALVFDVSLGHWHAIRQ